MSSAPHRPRRAPRACGGRPPPCDPPDPAFRLAAAAACALAGRPAPDCASSLPLVCVSTRLRPPYRTATAFRSAASPADPPPASLPSFSTPLAPTDTCTLAAQHAPHAHATRTRAHTPLRYNRYLSSGPLRPSPSHCPLSSNKRPHPKERSAFGATALERRDTAPLAPTRERALHASPDALLRLRAPAAHSTCKAGRQPVLWRAYGTPTPSRRAAPAPGRLACSSGRRLRYTAPCTQAIQRAPFPHFKGSPCPDAGCSNATRPAAQARPGAAREAPPGP